MKREYEPNPNSDEFIGRTNAISYAYNQAIDDVLKKVKENADNWGAIPETSEYANGWNEARKVFYMSLKNLIESLSN